MKQKLTTSLTFQDGNSEQAMNFYVTLFDSICGNAKVTNITRWGAEVPEMAGKIMQATFELNGNKFMVSDSPAIHDWNFSPAVSQYIECDDDTELEQLFVKLSENGTVTMPADNYGFSQKFAWVIDQFGVSWQLNLA